MPQEWATSQNIALPHRENRANAAIMYKEGEDAPAPQTNILTVRPCTAPLLQLLLQLSRRPVACDAVPEVRKWIADWEAREV